MHCVPWLTESDARISCIPASAAMSARAWVDPYGPSAPAPMASVMVTPWKPSRLRS